MLENYGVLLRWLHINNTPVLYTEMIKLYLTTYKTNQQYTVHESRYNDEMMKFDPTNKTNK